MKINKICHSQSPFTNIKISTHIFFNFSKVFIMFSCSQNQFTVPWLIFSEQTQHFQFTHIQINTAMKVQYNEKTSPPSTSEYLEVKW